MSERMQELLQVGMGLYYAAHNLRRIHKINQMNRLTKEKTYGVIDKNRSFDLNYVVFLNRDSAF